MQKKIHVSQLRVGMYVENMLGSWMDHPFWRKSFKLDDTEDIRKIQASPVKEVIIDTSKGLDVALLMDDIEIPETDVAHAADETEVTPSPPLVPPEKSAKKIKRITASEERERATRVIAQSKKAVESMFHDVRMGKAVSEEAAMPLIEEISASVSRNEGALISLVRLKTQDDYTYMHSVAVCALMIALSKELGLGEHETREAGLAGLMHDIGKAMIPNEILNKPSALSNEEFDIVKKHPELGHQMLLEANINKEATLDVCLHHHEKMDGTGYPHKLADNAISLLAKMGAVCDVYDAVTSNRPYKAGWEPGVSLQRMAQWQNHFDQRVFKAFVKSVGIYPIGSIIRLKSGRLAVVVDQSAKSLLTPIVKVFFSTKSMLRIPVEVIDLSKPSANDQILGHDDPVAWGINDVSQLWAS